MPRHDHPSLELVWPNKERFLLSPRDQGGKPVWVDRDHPAASEVRLVDFAGVCGDVGAERHRAADNLAFTGDSLDVLRILAEHPEFARHYRGQFKCVYIDPPFNTGQAFGHYDDWMEHSTWLSFMRDRLLLVKELMAPDGSLWVHLDDVEVHRMRCLLDEVFGSGNHVGTVVWRSSDNSNNDAKRFSQDHNSILVYARQPGWVSNRLPATLEDLPHYKNPDGDPRGAWFDGNPLGSPSPRPNLRYELVGPKGDVITSPPNGWAWSRDTLSAKMNSGEIRFTSDGKSIRRRTYYEDHRGLPPSTVWADVKKTGASRQAKSELKRLFPEVSSRDLFDTPKPERFMERVFRVATNPGDLVLDCFGGSGTSAAVAHKMNRRWVTVELQPTTVRDFLLPRLTKVVGGADLGGVSTAQEWTGGGGFRTLLVQPSMYEVADDGFVLLSEGATNGAFARAMAAQLGFSFDVESAPFCGRRGRMRLAVFDGLVGPEEVRSLIGAMADGERVTVVAKIVLPGTEEVLATLRRGSRVRKAPRDILADAARRGRRREERTG